MTEIKNTAGKYRVPGASTGPTFPVIAGSDRQSLRDTGCPSTSGMTQRTSGMTQRKSGMTLTSRHTRL